MIGELTVPITSLDNNLIYIVEGMKNGTYIKILYWGG